MSSGTPRGGRGETGETSIDGCSSGIWEIPAYFQQISPGYISGVSISFMILTRYGNMLNKTSQHETQKSPGDFPEIPDAELPNESFHYLKWKPC